MRSFVRAFLSRWVAPLWPVTIVGIVVGALIGLLAFTSSGGHVATAVIRVDQPIDANQILSGTQAFPDAQPDYLAGEIAYLSSAGFVDSVQSKLNESSAPMLSAAQSGKSNLVTISDTADSLDEARRAVDAAVATYTDHVKQQTDTRYQAALDAVNAIIPQLEAALRAVQPPPDKPTDELVSLYLQRTALQVQLQRAPGVQIVEPTMESASGGKLSTSSLAPIGGGLVGGFLALALALTWRSRSGIISSPGHVEGAGVPAPLLPTLRLTKNGVDPATARAIYAQLPPPRTGDILVVGASAESGSATVARHVAFAAAEHVPVTTARADADDLVGRHGAEERAGDGGTTVIDGGGLENSPASLAAANRASLIVIVVRVGLDTAATAGTVTQACSNQGVPIAVVCTKAPLLRFVR